MRKLLPKPAGDPPSEKLPPVLGGIHKRQLVSVACNACRKRKTKCDNRRPTCLQCIRLKTECQFAAPVAKGHHGALKGIIDFLHSSSADQSIEILNKIRLAPSVDDFVETFAAASLLLPRVPQRTIYVLCFPINVILWLTMPLQQKPLNISDDLAARFPGGLLPVAHWTPLSADNRYLTHLLNLFFSWDNTISRIVHRTMFLKDIKSQETSGLMFCSKFLIHSMLAVSHLYVSQGASEQEVSVFRARGRSFADKALQMLEQERRMTSIPLAQGLALLWIYEDNYGDKGQANVLLEGFYRVHEALRASTMESLEKHDVSDFESRMKWQAVSFVSWGFFCLEVRISLIFSREMRIRRPEISKTFIDPYSSMFAGPEASEYSWFSYPGRHQRQPSHFMDLMTYECQLAELAWEASRFFSLPNDAAPLPSYNTVKAIYDKISVWHTGATQRFLLNSRPLPSILFLDVTCEMILLELLSCLIRFPSHQIDIQTPVSTRALYGVSVISSLWVYRAAHGLRHEYWLKQACFSAVTAILFGLGDNPTLSKSVFMACQLLYAMGEYLPVANRCLWDIKEFAKTRGIEMPKPCQIIFSGLTVRTGKIVIKNANLINLRQSQNHLRPLASPYDITFSSRIESIGAIAGSNE